MNGLQYTANARKSETRGEGAIFRTDRQTDRQAERRESGRGRELKEGEAGN